MKTIKIEIKTWAGEVLFSYSCKDNTIRKTVEQAVSERANLRFANLRFANLRFADLSSANLSSADLRFADLSFANLSFANLSSADLSFADLSSADLSSADLSSADLSSANLSSADLSFANLSSAKNLNGDYTDFWWHIHHETLVEYLSEPVRARINYIKGNKPKDEVELRLRLLKPVLGDIPATQAGWEKLHKKECGCGWNGKTIFTKKNGLVR